MVATLIAAVTAAPALFDGIRSIVEVLRRQGELSEAEWLEWTAFAESRMAQGHWQADAE